MKINEDGVPDLDPSMTDEEITQAFYSENRILNAIKLAQIDEDTNRSRTTPHPLVPGIAIKILERRGAFAYVHVLERLAAGEHPMLWRNVLNELDRILTEEKANESNKLREA